MKIRILFFYLIFSCMAFEAAAQNDPTTPVVIRVEGLRNGRGFLAMSLFDRSAAVSFPSDEKKALRTFYVPLEGKNEIDIQVNGLPIGDYAVSVMHDEEADHKMHFNLVGIPIEGFGFSNNPTIYFGPPSFKRAKLHLDSTSAVVTDPIEIKMKYFL